MQSIKLNKLAKELKMAINDYLSLAGIEADIVIYDLEERYRNVSIKFKRVVS